MKKIILLSMFYVSVSVAQENKTETIPENKIYLKQENEIETVQKNKTDSQLENKEISVENHLFNFYASLEGYFVNYEFKITNNFTFITGLGFGPKYGYIIYDPDLESNNRFMFDAYSIISVEPRFYYDLDNTLDDDIPSNQGGFFASKISIYNILSYPDTLNWSSPDDEPNSENLRARDLMIETAVIVGIKKFFYKKFYWEIGVSYAIGVFRNSDTKRFGIYATIYSPLKIGLTL